MMRTSDANQNHNCRGEGRTKSNKEREKRSDDDDARIPTITLSRQKNQQHSPFITFDGGDSERRGRDVGAELQGNVSNVGRGLDTGAAMLSPSPFPLTLLLGWRRITAAEWLTGREKRVIMRVLFPGKL